MALNERVQTALNAQINTELAAFYTYLSMSAYFEASGLSGFAIWMRHHAEEEMMHAMKIYDFVHQRRGRVVLAHVDAPQAEWQSAQVALENALHHEEQVTASINALYDVARQEGDHATASFLKWFIDEQVEEEGLVDDVLRKLNLIGDFGPGLYALDRELAAQTPSAAANDEATG